jgi:hypothetical protein
MRDTRNGEIADSLTILLGYHELLLDGALGPLTERQRSALMDLADRSRRLVILLREVQESPAAAPARSEHPATYL